jgi:two-component sensor histidine kinase
VQTLVAQLQGALAHESTGGTRWVITFPLEAS